MNRRKIVGIIWFAVNLILVIKYYWDSASIQCEPCLPEVECPPCQTNFMANFWLYCIIWNVVMILIMLALKNLKTSANSGFAQ